MRARLTACLAVLILSVLPAGALSAAWLTASGVGGGRFEEVMPDDTSTDAPPIETPGPAGVLRAACGTATRCTLNLNSATPTT
jgi:hypothetical protein